MLSALSRRELVSAALTLAISPAPNIREGAFASLANGLSMDAAGGTKLSMRSVEAAANAETLGPMALYPDPILRLTAAPVTEFGPNLERVCKMLVRGMRSNAITALQYGVDARIIALKGPAAPSRGSLVLVNPQIIARSDEERMVPWREICLVLPPGLEIDLLRDEWVIVSAMDARGTPFTTTLRGEASRALQHELDHLNGVLIIDHAGLDELPEDIALLEAPYHSARQKIAFSRATSIPASSEVAVPPTDPAAARTSGGDLLPGAIAVGGFTGIKAVNEMRRSGGGIASVGAGRAIGRRALRE